MQTMKFGLAALCVAVLLAAGEGEKETKAASRLFNWGKNENPSQKYLSLLQYVLEYSKCPGDVPCKPVAYIVSANHNNDLLFQKYKMRYVVNWRYYNTGALCDISFTTGDLHYLFKVNSFVCYYFVPPRYVWNG